MRCSLFGTRAKSYEWTGHTRIARTQSNPLLRCSEAERIEWSYAVTFLKVASLPGARLVSTVRSKLALDLYVMIRPRGGDFYYSAEQDVLIAKQPRADGMVCGILRGDGNIDIARARCLIEIARLLKATFHRAFDKSRELRNSGNRSKTVIASRADRVLGSGG